LAGFGNIWVLVNSGAIFLELMAILCLGSCFMGDFNAVVWNDRIFDWQILSLPT
jgi:hypothetical protein